VQAINRVRRRPALDEAAVYLSTADDPDGDAESHAAAMAGFERSFDHFAPLEDIARPGQKPETRSGPEQVTSARHAVSGGPPKTPPLTLAAANIVHVFALGSERIIPGVTLARLLRAADDHADGAFDPGRIACELMGIAELVGQLGGDEVQPAGSYFLELALRSIARRVEAMKDLPADAYQVRPAEAAR
jgi:hypothetical protein